MPVSENSLPSLTDVCNFKTIHCKSPGGGDPAVIDLICYLHPTHIAFQKAAQVLNNDVLAYLVNLHSFFKHSTAHREESGSGEMFRGNGGQFCRGTGSVFPPLRLISMAGYGESGWASAGFMGLNSGLLPCLLNFSKSNSSQQSRPEDGKVL